MTAEEAYDLGYAAYNGQTKFLENPFFNDEEGVGLVLGRHFVDGHVAAIIEWRAKNG